MPELTLDQKKEIIKQTVTIASYFLMLEDIEIDAQALLVKWLTPRQLEGFQHAMGYIEENIEDNEFYDKIALDTVKLEVLQAVENLLETIPREEL